MNQNLSRITSNQKLYVIVVILVIASIAFRLINNFHLEQTSILFIGLPALITVLMIKYSTTPKSAYGIVFKVITIFLLMSSILFGEGFVCILFTAPIFYGVAIIIVAIYQNLKKRKKEKLYSVLIIPLLILIAQPFGINTIPAEVQSVETLVLVKNDVSFQSFNQTPDFLKNYPNFFKMGFPKPININGNGINIGDKREIEFESNTKGIGILSLEIIESNAKSIVFKPILDNTHINHWLTWQQMKVEIIKVDENQNAIKWTSEYQCDLGPSWYFEPLEKVAVAIMNKHLTNAYFN